VTLLDLLVVREPEEREGSFRGCLSSSWQSSLSLDEQTTADSHFRLASLYLEQANYYSHKAHEREDRLTLARQHGAPPGLTGLAAQQTEQAENMRRWMHQALRKYIELASVPLYRTDPRRDQALATTAALLSLLDKPAQVQHFWSLLLQEYPRSPYVAIGHLALGESYFRNQDYPRSLQLYQAALRGGSGPVSRYALYRIGHVQYALGDFPAALATFSRVIAAADGP
jgi:tetratricopeptide (TPR) repeat protein